MTAGRPRRLDVEASLTELFGNGLRDPDGWLKDGARGYIIPGTNPSVLSVIHLRSLAEAELAIDAIDEYTYRLEAASDELIQHEDEETLRLKLLELQRRLRPLDAPSTPDENRGVS